MAQTGVALTKDGLLPPPKRPMKAEFRMKDLVIVWLENNVSLCEKRWKIVGLHWLAKRFEKNTAVGPFTRSFLITWAPSPITCTKANNKPGSWARRANPKVIISRLSTII